MIHITPVNKCRHYGFEFVTPIAITAKCNAHSLLMPDVHSKKNATRALAIMANTAQVRFDIMQCLLITSKMLDLCTVGCCTLLSCQAQTESRLTCLSASNPSSLFCWGRGAAVAGLMGLLIGTTLRAGLTPGEAVGCGPALLGCTAAMVEVPSASAAGFVWYSRLWLLLCITHAQLIHQFSTRKHTQWTTEQSRVLMQQSRGPGYAGHNNQTRDINSVSCMSHASTSVCK